MSDYPTDAALLRGCRAGDARAWDALVDRYERLVFSIPLRHGLSRDDATDIFQVTFSAFLQSAATLADDSNLGAWLATVARRHTWRALRHHQREAVKPDQDLSEDATALGMATDRSVEQWELMEWMHQGLARLSQRCRDLLLALYFDPDPPAYADLAARLGMKVGSIGPTRGRCLDQLRAQLALP